nr:hypothetical protein [Ignavibacteriaceae bacterium]
MQKAYSEKVIEYLEKKSFKSWKLEWLETPGVEIAIVIPAICEFKNIKRVLISLAQNDRFCLQKSLIVFVVNNSVSSATEIKDDNNKSISL